MRDTLDNLDDCFVQAEDGIRDGHVTGVQTCALPISHYVRPRTRNSRRPAPSSPRPTSQLLAYNNSMRMPITVWVIFRAWAVRSEERRVGKEWRARRSREW